MQIWSSRMQMTFNIEECKVLHLGSNNPNHQYTMPMSGEEVHTLEGRCQSWHHNSRAKTKTHEGDSPLQTSVLNFPRLYTIWYNPTTVEICHYCTNI